MTKSSWAASRRAAEWLRQFHLLTNARAFLIILGIIISKKSTGVTCSSRIHEVMRNDKVFINSDAIWTVGADIYIAAVNAALLELIKQVVKASMCWIHAQKLSGFQERIDGSTHTSQVLHLRWIECSKWTELTSTFSCMIKIYSNRRAPLGRFANKSCDAWLISSRPECMIVGSHPLPKLGCIHVLWFLKDQPKPSTPRVNQREAIPFFGSLSFREALHICINWSWIFLKRCTLFSPIQCSIQERCSVNRPNIIVTFSNNRSALILKFDLTMSAKIYHFVIFITDAFTGRLITHPIQVAVKVIMTFIAFDGNFTFNYDPLPNLPLSLSWGLK